MLSRCHCRVQHDCQSHNSSQKGKCLQQNVEKWNLRRLDVRHKTGVVMQPRLAQPLWSFVSSGPQTGSGSLLVSALPGTALPALAGGGDGGPHGCCVQRPTSKQTPYVPCLQSASGYCVQTMETKENPESENIIAMDCMIATSVTACRR